MRHFASAQYAIEGSFYYFASELGILSLVETVEENNMKLLTSLVILALFSTCANAQFFRALANLFSAPFRGGGGFNLFGPRFRDDGTQSPQATGRDEINPSDCGRDPNKGTGKLCFPDGILCQNRKFSLHKKYLGKQSRA